MAPKLETEGTVVTAEDVDPGTKTEQYQIENAEYNLNRVDIELMAKKAIKWNSKATLRLAVVILIQGLSTSSDSFSCPCHHNKEPVWGANASTLNVDRLCRIRNRRKRHWKYRRPPRVPQTFQRGNKWWRARHRPRGDVHR